MDEDAFRKEITVKPKSSDGKTLHVVIPHSKLKLVFKGEVIEDTINSQTSKIHKQIYTLCIQYYGKEFKKRRGNQYDFKEDNFEKVTSCRKKRI